MRCAKFIHDVFDMNLDRLFGNEETLRNFPGFDTLGPISLNNIVRATRSSSPPVNENLKSSESRAELA